MHFDILNTAIHGLRCIQRKPIGDSRGYLERIFCSEELRDIIDGRPVVQVNHTLTATLGTVRGMHYQRPPHAEMKFVSCLRGKVFDVAVDLRRGSPTFLQWHAEILSAENHKTFVIPEGFAHGFQALTERCEMLYLHTAAYEPAAEAAVNAMDPSVAIAWPSPVTDMSERDRGHAMLCGGFEGIMS